MGTAETDHASPSAENLLENPNSPLVIVGQILCIVVPLAVWFAPLPLEPVTKRGFAIVGFMVVAWITRAMDYALAGFVGCFLFWALGGKLGQRPNGATPKGRFQRSIPSAILSWLAAS
jgi:hypothetical protein